MLMIVMTAVICHLDHLKTNKAKVNFLVGTFCFMKMVSSQDMYNLFFTPNIFYGDQDLNGKSKTLIFKRNW